MSVAGVDIGGLDLSGPSGAVWSLPHGGDLDANVVVVRSGDDGAGGIGAHRNDEVDVVLVGVAGSGTVVVDGRRLPLGAGRLVHVPKGAVRAVQSDGPDPLVYVTVHRARTGLTVGPRHQS